MTYKEYIQSPEWAEMKRRFRKSGACKNECFICKSKDKRIHIHHKSYKRFGKENVNDLIELCEDCHALLHKKLKENKNKKINRWNISTILRLELKRLNKQ